MARMRAAQARFRKWRKGGIGAQEWIDVGLCRFFLLGQFGLGARYDGRRRHRLAPVHGAATTAAPTQARTTNHGGTFQTSSIRNETMANPKSAAERIALVQTGL